MYALKTGEFLAARRRFEDAVQLDAGAPLLWFHLALARRAQGDVEAEAAALEKALELDPYFYLALLQKATLLERRGKHRHAAQVYRAFLQCVPPGAQQAPGLQQGLERARAAVAANGAALERFLQSRLAATQAAHRDAAQERFNHCLDALLDKRRIYTPQPTLMHFPGCRHWSSTSVPSSPGWGRSKRRPSRSAASCCSASRAMPMESSPMSIIQAGCR